MEENKNLNPEEQEEKNYPEPDDDWAHGTIQELLDFWEEQGVYIRE